MLDGRTESCYSVNHLAIIFTWLFLRTVNPRVCYCAGRSSGPHIHFPFEIHVTILEEYKSSTLELSPSLSISFPHCVLAAPPLPAPSSPYCQLECRHYFFANLLSPVVNIVCANYSSDRIVGSELNVTWQIILFQQLLVRGTTTGDLHNTPDIIGHSRRATLWVSWYDMLESRSGVWRVGGSLATGHVNFCVSRFGAKGLKWTWMLALWVFISLSSLNCWYNCCCCCCCLLSHHAFSSRYFPWTSGDPTA
jgi:hypothetical protein